MPDECKSSSESAEAFATNLRLEDDKRRIGQSRKTCIDAIQRMGTSPPAVQVKFLRELVEDSQEAERFIADPLGYTKANNVTLDPDISKLVVNSTLFDVGVSEDLINKLGTDGVKDLLILRNAMKNSRVLNNPRPTFTGGNAVVTAAAANTVAVYGATAASLVVSPSSVRGFRDEGLGN